MDIPRGSAQNRTQIIWIVRKDVFYEDEYDAPGEKAAGRTDRRSPHLIYAASTALAAKDYATGGETALRFSNSGMGDNTLAPRGTATRGQAAVILMGLDKLAGL